MSDWDKIKYPRTWGEMSFDLKALFAYHIAMMAMMMAGTAISASGKLAVAGGIAAGAAVLSVQHRRSAGWRWRRPGPMQVLGALGSIVLVGLFLAAAVPEFPPTNPNALPWYLAGLGIMTMNTLHQLRITYLAESDFRADCGGAGPSAKPAAATAPPSWKIAVRTGFSIVFLAVWLDGVASFYLSGIAMRDALPSPTETANVPYTEHGKTVYVTTVRKAEIDITLTIMMFGIPGVMITALFLQRVVGVKVIPNMPVRGEKRSL